MESQRLTPPSGHTQSHTTPYLKYWVHTFTRPVGFLVVESLVRVPGGVLYLGERVAQPPEATALTRRCLDRGQFSPRPYLLGQATDDSTLDCVMALYEDCCRRAGLDPAELLARTYPGWESRANWNDDRWQRIRAAAQWQDTPFPLEWTSDGVIGLVLSLTGHYRFELATTLASTLAR